jgi:radical SAM protein with 4Fe4S-binding SPASM domain
MEYVKFVTEVAAEYMTSGEFRRYPIEPILSALQRVNNRRSRFCNFDKRKCPRFTSLYPDGFVSLCDTLPGKEFSVLIKDSVADAVKTTMKSDNFRILVALTNDCEKCDVFQFCMGGCMAHRYAFRNNPKLAEEYCKSRAYLASFFQRFHI